MHKDADVTHEPQQTDEISAMEPTVRENVQEELLRLRDDLYRIAHDVRMKSKGASAEIQDTRRMLEREVKRFGAEVGIKTDGRRRKGVFRFGAADGAGTVCA